MDGGVSLSTTNVIEFMSLVKAIKGKPGQGQCNYTERKEMIKSAGGLWDEKELGKGYPVIGG